MHSFTNEWILLTLDLRPRPHYRFRIVFAVHTKTLDRSENAKCPD